MTGLLKDVLEDRADRVGDAVPDLAAIMATGDRRRRRTRTAAVGGVALTAAAVMAVAVVATPGRPGGTDGPAQAADPGWSPRDLSYASGSRFHVAGSPRSVDAGNRILSYVATDDGFVWAAEDGTVSFQPADGDPGEAVGTLDRDGRLTLAGDDAGPLAAWIDVADPDRPELVVYDTAQGEAVLRTGEGLAPGMGSLRDEADTAIVFGLDGDSVTWLNRDGIVRTDLTTGVTRRLGAGGGFDVQDVGAGLIASDAGDEGGLPLTRVGPSLTEGREVPHSGSATVSPGGSYVSFEDADALVVTDLATGEDVQPDNPGYAFWVITQWLDDDTFGGFGLRSIDDEESDSMALELLRCDVPRGDCTVLEEVGVDPSAFALPVGESMG